MSDGPFTTSVREGASFLGCDSDCTEPTIQHEKMWIKAPFEMHEQIKELGAKIVVLRKKTKTRKFSMKCCWII